MVTKHIKGRGVWIWGAAAALLAVTVLLSNQAFSASTTVTARPLQNSGGDLTYTTDYSSASAIVTRHESSDLTINGSDQVTNVTVQGTKASGAANVTVDLLDAADTILDTATVALSSASGAYSTAAALTLGTVAYSSVVKVSSAYSASAPVTITLDATDGWDQKDSKSLASEGTLSIITSSNDDWYQTDTPGGSPGYFLSVEFDQTVPVGATIVSTKVYIEHFEDSGFKSGDLGWEVGTGTLTSPTILSSTTPAVLNGSGNEAVVLWDVSAWIDTEAEANDIKVKVINNSTNGKKTNLDHIYVVVEYTP